ncbi:hypothetical protein Oter_4452 [Opitutus terrae PB90-1]|uniref:Uncharacterized protein n=1 Tax=Opitutus terrae (strain DSM 11246 / JCM 15787 / PB90-1) TaxID=452637 RepID=B1ZQ04_OPITP|nr:hypothetical protein Oter_4452 [Opitutus terrae PB90-1]
MSGTVVSDGRTRRQVLPKRTVTSAERKTKTTGAQIPRPAGFLDGYGIDLRLGHCEGDNAKSRVNREATIRRGEIEV